MSMKSKSSLSDWCECIRCKKIVNSRHVGKHEAECASLSAEDDVLSHGYIYGGILHGFVASVSDGELQVDQVVSKLSAATQRNLVYIHPSCLALCNLSIGQPCVVDREYVQTVWPCPLANPSMVGLSAEIQEKLRKKSKDPVCISPLDQPQRQAAAIQIQSRNKKDFYSNEEFSEFLQNELDGNYFAKDNSFSFYYFGQLCSFDVTKIEGFSDHIELSIANVSNSEDSLAEKFGKIKITGTPTAANQRHALSESLPKAKDEPDSSLSLNTTSFSETTNSDIASTKRTTEDCLPATPNSNTRVNRHFLSNNSFSKDLPLDSSTPVKVPATNIPGFQTPTIGDVKSQVPFSGRNFYKITSHTKIDVNSSEKEKKEKKNREDSLSVTLESVGGLKEQIETLKEMIELPLMSPQILSSYGLTFPKGILLYGPSGCGKTFLMKAIANQMGCYVTKITGPSIWSKYYGETESRLRDIFKTAQERSPSLIIMDEVDTLCPKRQGSNSELEKRVVSTLLALMDGLNNETFEKMTLVLAATNKPDMVDSALRRPGRFDREVEIGIPTAEDRYDILQKMLQKIPNTILPEELKEISDAAHGFVGADLLAVCKEANLQAIKTKDKSQITLSASHLTYGLNMVQPSAMRQVQLEVPKVHWCDIGGQVEVKQKLKQAIEWPLKHPEVFIRMGVQPPKGILLYGPPGCSKTMIAKALATESGLNFIAIKGPELFNKWVGESEKAVREVFRKARAAAPSVVFFDEIDALAVERGSSSGSSNVEDRVLAQLLTELDGVESLRDVTVVAATNRPDMIDKALLRPGRIDRIMHVPLPDRMTREEIFRIKLKKMPIADDIDIQNLAETTERYSGAEISAVCHEAALFAMQEDINIDKIQQRHFQKSLKVVQPRITNSLLEFYKNYEQKSSLHPV